MELHLKNIRGLRKAERRYGHDEPKRCVACRRWFRPKPRSREQALCPRCERAAKRPASR